MNTEEQGWMSVKETARLLQIPLSRCYELIHAGEIPGAVRVGERSIRVNKCQLEKALLEQRRVARG
jgi:excisionase family DNA binding protein